MRTELIPLLLLLTGVFLLKPKKAQANPTHPHLSPSAPEANDGVVIYSSEGQAVPAPVTTTESPSIFTAGVLPRGIRNNNPGNIRLTGDRWQGMAATQTDGAFVQFTHPKYGFRAMTRVLRNYQRQGINTVDSIISRWAPSNENHTAAYVKFVSNYTGIAPTAEVNLSLSILPLIKAITIYENGQDYANYYSNQTIQEGIALA